MQPEDIPQFNDDDDTLDSLPLDELLRELAARQGKPKLSTSIDDEPDTSEIDATEEAVEHILAELASETRRAKPLRSPTPLAQPTPPAAQPEQVLKPLSVLLDAQLVAEEQLSSEPQEGLRPEPLPAQPVRAASSNQTLYILAGVFAFILIVIGLAVAIALGTRGLPPMLANLGQPAPAPTEPEATPLPTETISPTAVLPAEKPEDTEPTFSPAQAAPAPGDQVEQNNSLMAYIPASTFEMGNDTVTAESPAHRVSLDAFYIDVFEVTNAKWAECVDAGVCNLPGSTQGYDNQPYYSDADFADYPVAYVSWDAAQEFCAWRGTRLPTEAEWELAARFDPEDQSVSQYPWGSRPQRGNLNYCDSSCLLEDRTLRDPDFDDGYPQMSPVGAFERDVTALGIQDMGGNMVEWVSDWFSADYYASSPDENPTGPEEGTARTVRGGGWSLPVEFARSTRRAGFGPDTQAAGIGFRCAVGAADIETP